MPVDKQLQPLGAKSDEEFGVFNPRASKPQKRSNKCLVYFLAALVILAAIALVFAIAVQRVDKPHAELRSVSVKNLRYSTSPSPSLNATLTAEVSIRNKNFGAFDFDNGTATVRYEGMVVGEKKFSGGHVDARKTERMNVTFDVRSEKLWADRNLSSDISSGRVNLIAYAQISGKVRVMKVVMRRTMATMNCTVTLNLTAGSIQDLVC